MLFDGPGPRVFGLPPGVDFPAELLAGLRDRLGAAPPDAMARVTVYVNTERMRRRLTDLLLQGPPGLLPQLRLVTDLTDPLTRSRLPSPIPPLRRRLEVAELVGQLLRADPSLAAQAARFDLADSLVALMEEMHGEAVAPKTLAELDVSDQSGHWQRALRFFDIVQRYFKDESAPDPQAYQRLALAELDARWTTAPPQDPILVAGSTGSRGTTAALMRLVADLPQGAVVLPGVDDNMPSDIWAGMSDAMVYEDHPQFRFAKLMQAMQIGPDHIAAWTKARPPNDERNKLISLALRPAPVTDQWLHDGPNLPNLSRAMRDVTLIEAPSPRDEAMAIALRLRQAAETGESAALITPDRMLTRHVTAMLDRWDIVPDDSAGEPARLSPPGRFLRHTAQLLVNPLNAETLLTVLKHPLTASTEDRGPHLKNTGLLDLVMRKKAWAFPDATQLAEFGETYQIRPWAHWVAETCCTAHRPGTHALETFLDAHLSLAERIAGGPSAQGSGGLWDQETGRAMAEIIDGLRQEAHHGGTMSASDYQALFDGVLSREEIRKRDDGHPNLKIWGTIEARVMGVDVMILGGLNEGTWPGVPTADPWLNRQMRARAGLLLPERQIGLSAHDFQQAAGAKEVWLTRASKSDDAETVPARWLNRIANLMLGLPERCGPEAYAAMQARGDAWLSWVRLFETPKSVAPEPRPSPVPPVSARPRTLTVTEIRPLIRDPYTIYARHVLGLRPLDPLMRAPDALMRGVLLHDVLERFVKRVKKDPRDLTAEMLVATAQSVLRDPIRLPFRTTAVLWEARLARVAAWFTEGEKARQRLATPGAFEVNGKAKVDAFDVTLKAKADRIDLDAEGGAHIYDYKTGTPPSAAEQKHFDKQLLLEAAIAVQGGFDPVVPQHIARAVYIGLSPSAPKEVPAPLDEIPPTQVWEEFCKLIAAFMAPDHGYTARRAMHREDDVNDYDHLARFGEWTEAAPPRKIFLP